MAYSDIIQHCAWKTNNAFEKNIMTQFELNAQPFQNNRYSKSHFQVKENKTRWSALNHSWLFLSFISFRLVKLSYIHTVKWPTNLVMYVQLLKNKIYLEKQFFINISRRIKTKWKCILLSDSSGNVLTMKYFLSPDK